jgi:hypothetical protein
MQNQDYKHKYKWIILLPYTHTSTHKHTLCIYALLMNKYNVKL